MPSRRTFFKRASGIVAAAACALYIPAERLEFGVPKALASVGDYVPSSGGTLTGVVTESWTEGVGVYYAFPVDSEAPSYVLPAEEPRGVTLMDYAMQRQDSKFANQIVKMFEEYDPVLELVNGMPRADFIEGWEPETRLPPLQRWVSAYEPRSWHEAADRRSAGDWS